jgi:hypothetical protein
MRRGTARGCPCPIAGRSLRPSWAPLSRRRLRSGIHACAGRLRRLLGHGQPLAAVIVSVVFGAPRPIGIRHAAAVAASRACSGAVRLDASSRSRPAPALDGPPSRRPPLEEAQPRGHAAALRRPRSPGGATACPAGRTLAATTAGQGCTGHGWPCSREASNHRSRNVIRPLVRS